MIVRRSIAADLVEQLDAIMPDARQRLEATADDPMHANVHDYLGVQVALPHESILRWIDMQLPCEQGWTGHEKEGHIAWARKQLSGLDLAALPRDLAWAVSNALQTDRVDSMLRVVHACTGDRLDLACRLQPLIDQMDERLRSMRCAERALPMIVSMPRVLDQSWRRGRMSYSFGICLWRGEHMWTALDLVRDGLAQSEGWAREQMLHTLVHEMIHGCQSENNVGNSRYGAMEGMTEMLVEQMGLRTIGSYDSELALAHRIRERAGANWRIAVEGTHDMRDLFARYVDIVEQEELRYVLEGRAVLAHQVAAQHVRVLAQIASRDGLVEPDAFRWQVEPDLDITRVARDLGRVHGFLGDAARSPHFQAAALLIWCAHVMDEQPIRALVWLGGDEQTFMDMEAIARWRCGRDGADDMPQQWIRSLAPRSRDTSLWARAVRYALLLEIDDLVAHWPVAKQLWTEHLRQQAEQPVAA